MAPSLRGADDAQQAEDERIVGLILKMENFDLKKSAKAQAAVDRYLKGVDRIGPGIKGHRLSFVRHAKGRSLSTLVQRAVLNLPLRSPWHGQLQAGCVAELE